MGGVFKGRDGPDGRQMNPRQRVGRLNLATAAAVAASMGLIVVVAPAARAQPQVGTVRESPFAAGSARLYDVAGNFVGTARDNAFVPGRTDLYDAEGRSTDVQVRDNAFDPDRRDILDEGAPEEP